MRADENDKTITHDKKIRSLFCKTKATITAGIYIFFLALAYHDELFMEHIICKLSFFFYFISAVAAAAPRAELTFMFPIQTRRLENNS